MSLGFKSSFMNQLVGTRNVFSHNFVVQVVINFQDEFIKGPRSVSK